MSRNREEIWLEISDAIDAFECVCGDIEDECFDGSVRAIKEAAKRIVALTEEFEASHE